MGVPVPYLHRHPFTPPTLLFASRRIMGMHEYQIVGRKTPTEKDTNPKIFRMRIFAPDHVVAKSKFWYFMSKLKKVKKSNGQILACHEIYERRPEQIKNFGIFLRYYSRSGISNMHKEYRDTTRTGAVEQMFSEMAGRHRATFHRISIIEVNELKPSQVRRANTKQFHDNTIKFPLPHRVQRVPMKKNRKTFLASRTGTHW